MKIDGNTIFIAGGTSGIGLGLARHLQENGNTVIVGGRRTELLAEIAESNPGIDTVVVDTADPDSILAARDEIVGRHPDLNVLVTMAGIMLPEDLHTSDFLEVAEATVTTNLLGTIRLVGAFVSHLSGQDPATIITVSSGLAFVPLPATPTYNATKAAIHSFSESMRVQLADTPIEVIELVPPAVRTALMNQEERETAMPLDEFLAETMALLADQPEAPQVLVERVKPLRHAVANGTYDEMLTMLSNFH